MTSVNDKIGRPVRVMSLGFAPTGDYESVAGAIDREARAGVDIIALPETWHTPGDGPPEPLDGPIVTCMRQAARRNNAYLVCPLDRTDGRDRYNSAVLIDRRGEVVGVYDKVYPVLGEFDKKPPMRSGTVVPVFQCDFGKLGLAICFDANFPELWRLLAEQGAELVIWPSAYSAGATLQTHALSHHYYIVTSTMWSDCTVWDITGRQLMYQRTRGLNAARITLDLDRGIFHQDYNSDKIRDLLARHAGEVEAEPFMDREGWQVLQAIKPGVSVHELAKRYGIEDLRDYIPRSRREIDALRGRPPQPMK